ncbi:hypothetical protein GSI_11147 [Ganoderma sinense ZZ0214-1]|uniref:HNH nuclease domain-containing protein n=1 Tax=Ganoderma sinense ZZ0214-1 TaxID=1077348 RepID=A0A2G8RYY9_9APHY|nr:hypothetical protein GSI_11147 [Ganoderma sinense ZZ0214-1]
MSRVDNLPSPQPLEPDFAHPASDVVSAYTTCRLAERLVDPMHAPWPPKDETARLKLVNIRILGHLLCQFQFLSERAVSEVARAILACRNGSTGAGEVNVEELSKLVRKFAPRFPEREEHDDHSSSPSPTSFRLTEDEVNEMLLETPMSDRTLRKLAMRREDYRCIATRILDYTCALRVRTPNGGMYDGDAECLDICRILPNPPNTDLEQGEKACESCAGVYGVLSSLGYTDIIGRLATTNQGQSLENVMVLTRSLLRRFNALDLWFEPIEDIPNCYRVCSILKPPHKLTKGQQVTFRSTDPRLPLPNREFLHIRAACCRVAHLSGASDIFRELESAMASDPDPAADAAEFAKALHAHLEGLSFTRARAANN